MADDGGAASHPHVLQALQGLGPPAPVHCVPRQNGAVEGSWVWDGLGSKNTKQNHESLEKTLMIIDVSCYRRTSIRTIQLLINYIN